MNILITGSPGIGKTTLICRLIEGITAAPLMGFYTREIRQRGVRQGFELIGLDGSRATLAHTSIKGRQRVGKYGVDVKGFEAFLTNLKLESAASWAIIDEIGKMECFSRQFCRSISQLLNSKIHVVATIAMRGHGLIADIKKRPDCELFLLTNRNRSHLHEQILNKIQ